MRTETRRFFWPTVVAALALAGCGYKGDLVLPEQEPTKLPEKPKEASDPDPEAGAPRP